MLLQTNSYIVPKEKRTEHARLLHRFRQTFARLGCDSFEAYEQTGANWHSSEPTGRFVQIMRFRDRKHQQQIQQAERNDSMAQNLIREFCELINFPYQQQQGLFAVGFYNSVLPVASPRVPTAARPELAEKEPDETPGETPAAEMPAADVPTSEPPPAHGLQASEVDSESFNEPPELDISDLHFDEAGETSSSEGQEAQTSEPQITSDELPPQL